MFKFGTSLKLFVYCRMLSFRFVVSILACASFLLHVNADIPPSPGPYTISNAQSGLVLNLDGPDSNYDAREYHFNVPYHSFVQQRWTFSPSNAPGNSGTLIGGDGNNQGEVFPPVFLACAPTSGATCNAVETANSDTNWILQPKTGGWLIISAQDQSLALTAKGVSLDQVFLSPLQSGNLLQLWVFAGYTTTGCSCCACGVP